MFVFSDRYTLLVQVVGLQTWQQEQPLKFDRTSYTVELDKNKMRYSEHPTLEIIKKFGKRNTS